MSSSEKPQKPPKLPLPMKLVVGAIAGAVGTSCIFPIDMVKTRLQASSGSSKYSGPINCFQTIVRTEGGYRALYRGLNANLVGVIPGISLLIYILSCIHYHLYSFICLILSTLLCRKGN
jgi:hypothetical protein